MITGFRTGESANETTRFVVLSVLLIGCAGVMGGCKSKQQGDTARPPRPVSMDTAETQDVPVFVESFGHMSAFMSVDITPQVSGKIEKVHFKDGQQVKKGDVLFSIDDREKTAGLKEAEATLAADRADLKIKQLTLDRNKSLLQKKLISRQDFDQYEADVAAAQAKVNLDEAGVDDARIQLEYCTISSPVDGLAGKHNFDAGNVVTPSSGALVNIRTMSSLYVDFTVSENHLDSIRDAMKTGSLTIDVKSEGMGTNVCKGALTMLDNSVDSTTGTILLRGVIDNADGTLWPGQYVTVRLLVSTEKNAVTVSKSAVQLGRKGEYAFVAGKDMTVDLRSLQTGPEYDERIVIYDGIKAGEKVVTQGQIGLAPGVKVADSSSTKKQPATAGDKPSDTSKDSNKKQKTDVAPDKSDERSGKHGRS